MAEILTQEEINALLEGLNDPLRLDLTDIKNELIYLYNRTGTYEFKKKSPDDQIKEIRDDLLSLIEIIENNTQNELCDDRILKNKFIDTYNMFNKPDSCFLKNDDVVIDRGIINIKDFFRNTIENDQIILLQNEKYAFYVDKKTFIDVYNNVAGLILNIEPLDINDDEINGKIKENIDDILKYNQEFFTELINDDYPEFDEIKFIENINDIEDDFKSNENIDIKNTKLKCAIKYFKCDKYWGTIGISPR